jgi:hypothetical protein
VVGHAYITTRGVMKKPFVLIAAIFAVVGLATTPQSGLAD